VALARARDRRTAVREWRVLRRLGGVFTPAPVALVRDGDGATWIATEWIEGPPLDDSSRASAWTEVARALVHLGRMGVVHGDLKASNVLVPADGPARLIDLESASRIGEVPDPEDVGGTPGLVAPERRPGWPADVRSDLWTFGRLLEAIGPRGLGDGLAERLTAFDATVRPSAEEALTTLRTRVGPGTMPRPPRPSRIAGGRARFDEARLVPVLRGMLGLPGDLSYELAHTLLKLVGRDAPLIDAVLLRWVTRGGRDPWDRPRTEEVRRRMAELTPIARQVIDQRRRRLPLAERRALPLLALIGPRVGRDEVRAYGAALRRDGRIGDARAVEAGAERIVDLGFDGEVGWELARARRPRRIPRRAVRSLMVDGGDAGSIMRDATRLDAIGDRDARARSLDAAVALREAGRTSEAATMFECAVRGGRHTREGRSRSLFTSRRLFSDPRTRSLTWEYVTSLRSAGRLDDARVALEGLRCSVTRRGWSSNWCAARADLASAERDHELQIELARRGLSSEWSPSTHARLELLEGTGYLDCGQLSSARPLLVSSYRRARSLNDDRIACDALRNLGVMAFRSGRPRLARRLLRGALGLARKTGSCASTASVLLGLAAAEHATGHRGGARGRLSEVSQDPDVPPKLRLTAFLNDVHLATSEERWDDAVVSAEAALPLALTLGDPVFIARTNRFKAEALQRVGRIAEAERSCVEGLAVPGMAATDRVQLGMAIWSGRLWFRHAPIPPPSLEHDLGLLRGRIDARLEASLALHTGLARVLSGRDVGSELRKLVTGSSPPDYRTGLAWLAIAIGHARAGAVDEARGCALRAIDCFPDEQGTRWFRAFSLMTALEVLPDFDLDGCWRDEARALAARVRAHWIEARVLLSRP